MYKYDRIELTQDSTMYANGTEAVALQKFVVTIVINRTFTGE